MPTNGEKDRGDLLRGALEMLILRTLEHEAMHGYSITESILEASQEILGIDEGSMYPALYRMQKRGWIEAEWGLSDNNRKAKFYRLTTGGSRALAAETSSWDRYVDAVAKVLSSQPGTA